MKKMKLISYLSATLCMAAMLCTTTSVQAEGYGKVIGKFVFKGDPAPKPELEHRKGAAVKDPKVCAAKDLFLKNLVVDEKSKGIKNIFIYIKKMKSKDIHPDLKKSKVEVIDYDQIGCMFEPHAMFVRTDQKVRVLSDDNCPHNFHTLPLKQNGENFLVGKKDRKGTLVQMKASESLPTTVKCDIHSWMKGYWMVLDHPYCAVTKADGSFEIDLVPDGKQDFRVWHEKKGYIKAGSRTGFKAKIKDGKVFDLGTIELTAKDLE